MPLGCISVAMDPWSDTSRRTGAPRHPSTGELLIDALGWFSSALLLVTIGVQVTKQWRDKTSKGVSPWLFIGQMAASTGFVVYSALVRKHGVRRDQHRHVRRRDHRVGAHPASEATRSFVTATGGAGCDGSVSDLSECGRARPGSGRLGRRRCRRCRSRRRARRRWAIRRRPPDAPAFRPLARRPTPECRRREPSRVSAAEHDGVRKRRSCCRGGPEAVRCAGSSKGMKTT